MLAVFGTCTGFAEAAPTVAANVATEDATDVATDEASAAVGNGAIS